MRAAVTLTEKVSSKSSEKSSRAANDIFKVFSYHFFIRLCLLKLVVSAGSNALYGGALLINVRIVYMTL